MNGIQQAAPATSQLHRVVITGVGLVTPVGIGAPATWASVLAGRSGAQQLRAPEYQPLPCRIAGLVSEHQLAASRHWPAASAGGDTQRVSRASRLALTAAREAVAGAGLDGVIATRPHAVGVSFGCGMDGLERIVDVGEAFRRGGYAKVGPYFLTQILNNMPAGWVAQQLGARGPNLSPNSACATGAHAVGEAFRLVRHGLADAVVCGGAEACVGPLAMAAFSRIRALATKFNDSPAHASRPFDKDRCGFVMSEGSAALVLESLDHAEQRGAEPLAEICGFGCSGDAFHLTAPEPNGEGALRCMRAALADAGWDSVGYVNAHATSTQIGDLAECRAIARLAEGEGESPWRVASSKGSVGHLIGAAGAAEAVLTALACHHRLLPHTANLSSVDFEHRKLVFVTGQPEQWRCDARRRALCNSFGFGGTNASLCIAQFG